MRITVVTICYNAEKCIESTMRSVLDQKYPELEYIIVDGLSKDSTNEVIDNVIRQYSNSQNSIIHISEKDDGISDAFNKGICRSTGDIIALINAGDMLTPNALSTVAENFSDDLDLLYGNLIWNDEKNGLTYVRKPSRKLYMSGYKSCILHPATFISKEAYNKFGLYRTEFKLTMDRELLARFLRLGAKMKYINYELAFMQAGGVSDQPERKKRKKDEGVIIARENGISPLKFKLYYIFQDFQYNLKAFLKKNTCFYKIVVEKIR